MLEVVRCSNGARLKIRSWLRESSTLKVADGFEIHQTALTLIDSDRWAQRSLYDVSKFAAGVSRALYHQDGGRTNCEITKKIE